MVCTDTALTCAVRELNETLQAGPSVFDWVVMLGVPLFLGVVTLGVAVLSLWVARQSNALAAASRADALEVTRRADRERVADAARVYIQADWRELDSGKFASRGWGPADLWTAFGAEAMALHRDRAEDLEAIVTKTMGYVRDLPRDENYQWIGPTLVADLDFILRHWVRDPDSLPGLVERLLSPMGLDKEL